MNKNPDNYCNPSFPESDLSDTMLSCYCPNNRKGTYIKKSDRSTEWARHCDDDATHNAGIRKALANRMFSFCESWCLFDFDNPMSTAWMWDPWNKCWSDQASEPSGDVDHSLYCNSVIRDPHTVEMQYILSRQEMACPGNAAPTNAPVVIGATDYAWVMGAE